jgi:7,8-dihydropterin-6-yl-methyl-4-(beta-D-ribofuranosyl)aminobenzene 5'-phosphate synthase
MMILRLGNMKISCLVDNRAKFASDLYAEHGFSLLLENDRETIVLDTGKTPIVLKHNLDIMGVETVDRVVLSHGHDDHTGGISALMNSETTFSLHPDGLIPKYAVQDGTSRYIGFPKLVDPNKSGIKMDFVTETIRIGSDMWIFNHIDKYNDFETIPQYLSIKKDGNCLQDKFTDELNLVIKTDDGLIVLSGCAHLGMVNILYSAMEYFQDEIYGVIGGSHLFGAIPQRIEKTVDEFKKISPELIALGHCTGFEALCRFKKEFKDKFVPLESGAEIML